MSNWPVETDPKTARPSRKNGYEWTFCATRARPWTPKWATKSEKSLFCRSEGLLMPRHNVKPFADLRNAHGSQENNHPKWCAPTSALVQRRQAHQHLNHLLSSKARVSYSTRWFLLFSRSTHTKRASWAVLQYLGTDARIGLSCFLCLS